jgi:hypothetical protein
LGATSTSSAAWVCLHLGGFPVPRARWRGVAITVAVAITGIAITVAVAIAIAGITVTVAVATTGITVAVAIAVTAGLGLGRLYGIISATARAHCEREREQDAGELAPPRAASARKQLAVDRGHAYLSCSSRLGRHGG